MEKGSVALWIILAQMFAVVHYMSVCVCGGGVHNGQMVTEGVAFAITDLI